MAEEAKSSNRSARAVSRKIANTVLDIFVHDLLDELNNRGKESLDRQEISEIAREFKRGSQKRYLVSSQKILADWLATIEKDYWEQNRRHPFERVLVTRFAHLFPPAESLSDERAVSRRTLPGLHAAFEQMVGAAFLEQCRTVARGIFRDTKEELGKEFSWKAFYDDHRANDLIDDFLAVVAWGFSDFDARLEWLCTTINAGLAPPEDYAFEGADVQSWTLGRRAAIEMMSALFNDFQLRLSHEGSRKEIQKRYGDRGLKSLTDLTRELAGTH